MVLKKSKKRFDFSPVWTFYGLLTPQKMTKVNFARHVGRVLCRPSLCYISVVKAPSVARNYTNMNNKNHREKLEMLHKLKQIMFL